MDVATAEEIFLQSVASHQAGDLDTAERGYRQLLSLFPDHHSSLTNLASIIAGRGEVAEAERLYLQVLDANPDSLEAHFKLGNIYRRIGRFQEAIEAYEEVLRRAPNTPAALVNLGLAVSDAGNWPRAVECFARAATVAPELPDVLDLLGDALARCGRRDEALAAFRESVSRFPDSPRAHLNLALHLIGSGTAEEAVPILERALSLKPNYAEAHNLLGVAFDSVGRGDDAEREYRSAIRIRPDFAEARANLGVNLSEQGQVAEATESLRQAIAANPNPMTGSTLLTNLLSSDLTSEQLRDEHIAWAKAYADQLTPSEPPRKRPPNTPGRIRVGYVFGEFRSRTAFAFLEAILTHHDRNQFHITTYANAIRKSEELDRVRRLADTWRLVTHVSDEQLASLIRADEIDILVDLNGHTHGNRLLTFARKPAAVQMSLFAYPATTGLKAINFHITDAFTDRPEAESLYVEKLLRLPDVSWVYVPRNDAPQPSAPPSAKRSEFTFGCLNHPGKISDACAETWSVILNAVTKSRLVLFAGTPAAAELLTARFTKHGVASDRLEILHGLPESDYLTAYQLIDLALDPFPYGGAVTTCDALWMGVPVLTLAGRDARARQSASVLNAIGLSEFVADKPEQLVNLATKWSEQRKSLAEIRDLLRDMMVQSPVMAAADYVKQLETAYRML